MTQEQLLFDLIFQKRWIPLAALVIHLVVRLLKSDTKLPIDVPPTARALLALGLGIVSGVLDKAVTGVPWPEAIVGGLLSGGGAIVLHDVVVAGLLGGREIPIPGLIIPGARPSPGRPPTIPPPEAKP